MSLKKVTYLIKEQPKNAAAYNRVRMLVDGLNNNGISSNIIFIPKTGNSKFLYYTRYILLLVRLYFIFFFSNKKKAIILYGEDTILKSLVKFPRRCLLIAERTEYSTYLFDDSLSPQHVASIKTFEENLKYVDAMIVCSVALENYYKQFCDKPICRVPLVYEESFIKQNKSKDNHTIVYCGDMGGGKDGVDILIKSFAIFNKSVPGYRLILIGGTSKPNVMDTLNQMTVDLGVSQNVSFTGWIRREEMPSYLETASLLVLSRPANKQAEGGIPSKLAEYLSTGRPVLTTKVGDLPLFFTNGKDLFFAEPDSVDDFSEKMISIFRDYNYSCIVGQNGIETVKQFDRNVQSLNMITFINSLLG